MSVNFVKKSKKDYYKLLDKVFESGFLSEGAMVKEFEKKFGKYTKAGAAAVSNGGAALLAILKYIDVKGYDVIVPSNTFMATPMSVKEAGGNVIWADCNKYDLCLSYEDLKKRVTSKTKAVIVVHIGGHIAFDILKIKEFCKKKKIFLVEDCAHAHGAEFKGVKPGSFGIAGAYSFYATKTMPLGEGGMVVSKDKKLIEWIKKFRNYGKFDYKVEGFNYRMNELTAAFGLIQLKNLPEILRWKRSLAKKYDKIFQNRVTFPGGMKSGYYKYIVFEKDIKEKTGKVYGELCHEIMKARGLSLSNSIWIKDNHNCLPMNYGWDKSRLSVKELKEYLAC
ncbi:MAG: DegT/DnrJ/EryC1/StrS family aminotransferase [Armatimonadota bacterium]